MTSLSTEWACYSVKKYALADMRLHVAVGSLGVFSCPIAKRTLCIKKNDFSLTSADGAFLFSQPDGIFYIG